MVEYDVNFVLKSDKMSHNLFQRLPYGYEKKPKTLSTRCGESRFWYH